MKHEPGRYCQGHTMTGGYPSQPREFLCMIRFIIYEDLKPLLKAMRPDGVELIDDLRRDISVRELEVWDLLHEDDQAAVVRFIKRIRVYRWGWVLQRQEDEEYNCPIPWADRVRSLD